MKIKSTQESKEEFSAEARELLEEMEQLLPDMVGWNNRDELPLDLINHFFRLVHSLKGLSGMMGLTSLSFLAHDLENLLAELRMGRLRFSEELISLLESCLEAFHALVASPSGESRFNLNHLLAQIEMFLATHRWQDTVKATDHLQLPDSILAVLTEYEESRLAQSLRQQAHILLLRVAFDFGTFDVDLEQINTRLKSHAEVITTLPTSGPGEDKIYFELLIASKLQPAELLEQARLEAIGIEEIPYRPPSEEQLRPSQAPAAPVETSLPRETQSVRVSLDKIDSALGAIGDLLLFKTQLKQWVEELRTRHGMTGPIERLAKGAARLEKNILGLQDRLVQMRMVPVRSLFGRLSHMATKLAKELNKDVEVVILGQNTELDKMVIDEMTDPLVHLVRNAVDHGIESPAEREAAGKPVVGQIQIRALHQGKRILIEVEDDGGGIDPQGVRRRAEELGLLDSGTPLEEQQLLGLLFTPGFSTRSEVTEISGRGVGMDVVKQKVVKLSGAIEISTQRGKGTRWTILLPVTLVIIPSLLVRVADQKYAVPMSSITRTYDLAAGDVPGGISDDGFELDGAVLPVHRLDHVFELEQGYDEPPPYLLVARSAERRVGFLVHEIEGREEIVVKPLSPLLAGVRGLAGATELGDGPPVLVLDMAALVGEVNPGALKA